MADATIKPVLSVCATIKSKLSALPIKDGQLIFVQDNHTIALDFNKKRTFYTVIEEIATEQDRVSILAPVTGRYYFVISTEVLWTYQNGWVQITSLPEQIVFIGTEMPELGVEKTLYVDKANEVIKVWNEDTQSYQIVADKTRAISNAAINALFA